MPRGMLKNWLDLAPHRTEQDILEYQYTRHMSIHKRHTSLYEFGKQAMMRDTIKCFCAIQKGDKNFRTAFVEVVDN